MAGRMKAIMNNPAAYTPITAESKTERAMTSIPEVTRQVTYATKRLKVGVSLREVADELGVTYPALRRRMDGRKIAWRAIQEINNVTRNTQ
jgi:hypothetical protein